ncbi:hypothetical protein MMC11_007524 [Xylographa trunciseda]|nr:hypothetical protein [Xylographa trunciseda]
MFARLRDIIVRSVFGRPNTLSIGGPLTVIVAEQNSQELAVEAVQDMVTTRARDHNLAEAVVDERNNGMKNGKKRNITGVELNSERESASAAKRKRTSHERDRESDKPLPLWNLGDDLESQSHKTPLQLSEQSAVTSQSTSTGERPILSDHVIKALPPSRSSGDETKATLKTLKVGVHDTQINATTQNGGSETIPRSNMGRKRKKADIVALTPSNGHAMTAISVIHSPTHSKDGRSEVKKSTHKRFGSEEPPIPLDLLPNDAVQDHNLNDNGTNKIQLESEDESEDDSPEVVTISAGLTQARTVAAEAAKAAETQSLARKQKRRARDVHLKEQAATSKKERSKRPKRPSQLDDTTSTLHDGTAANPKTSTAEGKNTSKRTDPLPDFLPLEILAAKRVVYPPTPLRIATIANARKRKFLDADPKPPKDLKRGSVTVRILEENKSSLPPRSSKLSKSLKESWLAGQRSRGDIASPRLKMGRGFVRK